MLPTEMRATPVLETSGWRSGYSFTATNFLGTSYFNFYSLASDTTSHILLTDWNLEAEL